MYFEIFSKLLILLIVLNYSYAKMYNDDLMDYIIKNKTISNVILKTLVMSKKIPVASLVLGIKEACKTYNSMKNIGCVICLDE